MGEKTPQFHGGQFVGNASVQMQAVRSRKVRDHCDGNRWLYHSWRIPDVRPSAGLTHQQRLHEKGAFRV